MVYIVLGVDSTLSKGCQFQLLVLFPYSQIDGSPATHKEYQRNLKISSNDDIYTSLSFCILFCLENQFPGKADNAAIFLLPSILY